MRSCRRDILNMINTFFNAHKLQIYILITTQDCFFRNAVNILTSLTETTWKNWLIVAKCRTTTSISSFLIHTNFTLVDKRCDEGYLHHCKLQ